MLRRGAANERLQKIKPAALWGEASEMECRLLAQMRSADCIVQGPLTGATRKSFVTLSSPQFDPESDNRLASTLSEN
jgi:hypothetical protein